MLVLYDDARARRFAPFALTRPAGELRAGAELTRRRWERALGIAATGFVGAEHLAAFEEPGAPRAVADTLPAGTILANSRFAVRLAGTDPEAGAWRCGNTIAAVRLADPLPLERLEDGGLALDMLVPSSARVAEVAGQWIEEVWDLVGLLAPLLTDDVPRIAATLACAPPASSAVLGSGHPVLIEEGAVVEPFVVFDVSGGPILIRRGATVQAFTRLVGPAYVAAGSNVVADRIACVSIGETCKVHGEVSNTVFLGFANKGHDGFVGHSILGRWVNLGAGTVTSNLKNTYGTVTLWTPGGVRDTGMQFLGTLFGDHVKTGIGLPLSTGTVLGAGANVFEAMPPKHVPPFAWGSAEPYDTYALDKFLGVAAKAMQRRSVALSDDARRQLTAAHARRHD